MLPLPVTVKSPMPAVSFRLPSGPGAKPSDAVDTVPVSSATAGRAVSVSTSIASVVVEVTPTGKVSSLDTWPGPSTEKRSGAGRVEPPGAEAVTVMPRSPPVMS